ncbi:unnamed protein product, partial [Staurois parvus]
YCVSCDWSQLVTWYKAVVNSLVPYDPCDHSQISHVVSNDVRSDILLTIVYVITDWPISGHMIGTSHRGPVQRSVFRCVLRTQRPPVCGAACSPGPTHKQGSRDIIYNWPPAPALLPSGSLYTWVGREVV